MITDKNRCFFYSALLPCALLWLSACSPRSAAIDAAFQGQLTQGNSPQTAREGYPRPETADAASVADEHLIVVYENNRFKEVKKAFDFPENMRYREVQTVRDGETVTQKVPVVKIEVLLIGADGKLTTKDKVVRIVIVDYAEDGSILQRNTMLGNGKQD